MSIPSLAILIACGLPLGAADPAGDIQVVGVNVGFDYPGLASKFQPHMYKKGVIIALLIPGQGIIAVDSARSTITAMKDSTGKDLKKTGDGRNHSSFNVFQRVSTDGTAALVSVQSDVVPATGAQSISVSGELLLSTGTKRATTVTKAVKLAAGSTVAWGDKQDRRFTIVSVDKQSGGIDIELKTTVAVTDIIGIALVDVSGTHAGESRGGSSMTMNGALEVTRSYRFQAAPDAADVAIEYWQDLKPVKVPFSIKAGIGP